MDTIDLLPEISIMALPSNINKKAESWKYEIINLNTKQIDDPILFELCEVIEDMWAWAWIKEFVKCNSCNEIFSKQDIFSHLPDELYKMTVAKIMNVTWNRQIKCPCCFWDTEFMYNPIEYIDILREKYRKSVDSFLTIVRNDSWEIVWFTEWYIDTLDTLISRRDLGDHYWNIPLLDIKKSIENIIWYNPPFIFLISAIGLLENYVNPYTLISMLNEFAKSIPDKYNFTPWLMELEKWHILYVVSEVFWWHKSWISYSRNFSTNNSYASDLLVFSNPVWVWKKSFWWWILNFLRTKRRAKWLLALNTPSVVSPKELELV